MPMTGAYRGRSDATVKTIVESVITLTKSTAQVMKKVLYIHIARGVESGPQAKNVHLFQKNT